ncbi:MAG: TetR family transcriptional regulator, partial [Phyllobacterium sp.]|uniref:TetR family transcriptional regulator n=1 Tax=Phyllobacterium sp. TaxID=1871046 RepID=UPI0030F01990
MANVNLIRRAEIGREKRVKTRAQLVEAANSLFAGRAVESVTVDDVVQEAGVAKGTFYTHFDSLEALTAAV